MTPRPITNRRQFLSLALLGTAGTVLGAACAQPPAPQAAAPAVKPTEAPKAAAPAAAAPTAAPAAAAKPSAGQTTLTFHHRAGSEAGFYEDRGPAFEAKFPNVKLAIEPFPTTEYYPKIATMAAGGTIGDAMWTSIGNGGVFFLFLRKTIAAVDDLVSRDKVDMAPYFPGCVRALTMSGKLTGLPFKAHPGTSIVFYNKKIFDQAGVKYPAEEWVHADITDIGKKVTKAPEYYGYLPTVNDKGLRTALRSFGGELLSEDGKKSLLNSKEGLSAIQFIDAMFHESKIAPSPDQVVGDSNAMWISGKLAMFQGGTSVYGTRVQIGDKFEMGAVPNPKGPAGVGGSDYEVDSFAVVETTKQKDQAWELVKFFCDQESGIRLGELGGTIGGRSDVYGSPRLLKDPLRVLFSKVMEKAQDARPVYNTRMDEYVKTIQQTLDPVWLGKEKPTKEFVDKVNDTIQKVLDKPLP